MQAAAQGALDLAIVILNYNTAGLLRDCLQSVLASRTNLRVGVCVVDNASTDGSAELVRAEFPDVHLIVNRHNVGYSAGNNIGLNWFGFGERHTHGDAARPRYALLLNPDTVVPPDALERMAAFLDARPGGRRRAARRRPDGSLDRACRRSFPRRRSLLSHDGSQPHLSQSKRFNAYNLEYLPEDAVHPVDSVVSVHAGVRRGHRAGRFARRRVLHVR